MPRLAILASHPVQYYGPLYRELACRIDLEVLFAHRATPVEQARAGYGVAFDWDVDITSGYPHSFLTNVSKAPGTDRFPGCDTPGIADRLAHGFDALLVHGWHLKTYLQGILAAKRRGLPVLVRGDSHLATPRSVVKRAIKAATFPALLRVFDAALYVGKRSRAYYEHYHFPQHRLFFSPHCVDAKWFAERATGEARSRLRGRLGVSDHTKLLLFAGMLMQHKRPLDLIRAADACRARGLDVEVLVAGDGMLRDSLTAEAKTLGLQLHILGFSNQTEMPVVYAAADCLILPSQSETWGLVVNEILACGRPAIISDACGCADDLAEGDTVSRRFPVGNVPALAAAIQELLSKPPSPEAIASVSDAYSLAAAADGIIAGLNECGWRNP